MKEDLTPWYVTIRAPLLVLLAMVLMMYAVVTEAQQATLTWTPPDSREDGTPIDPSSLEYYLYWALEQNGNYRQALDGEEVLVIRGSEYVLPEEIPGGADCIWLSMAAFEPATGLESSLSNSIEFCPGDIFVGGGDDGGNGDGDGGENDGSGEPSEPEPVYAPVPVLLDLIIVP